MAEHKKAYDSPTLVRVSAEGIHGGETPKSRPYKKYVIIAVSGLLAVAIILTAILVGMHLFTEAQKDIVRFSYNRDVNTKEEVTSDPNANVVQYHVINKDYEAWVINDFNRDIQAMKIRWERGTNCFLTPLNRTTADDPSAIKPPLDNQPANATYMMYYRSSNTPVAVSTFLGQTARNACNGLSTYWLFPVCEGSESAEARTFADMILPPFWDTDFGERFKALNMSSLDFDWELFDNYVCMKMEDMVLDCSFGNLPCNSSNAIKETIADQGFCVSFNPATANYITTQPGAKNGLRLVLWVNQSDCVLAWTPAVGFRVALHDPRDQPFMMDAGFRVGAGISSSVSFSLRNLSMLPSPYGDCRPNNNYTYMKCYAQCVAEFFVSACKCRPIQFDGTAAVCSLDKYYYCLAKFAKLFISSGAASKCDCPLQCYQPSYPFSASTDPISQHFLSYVSQHSQFKGRNLAMSKLGKELVYLDIFYSDLNYVDIQTTPAYNFLALVCDCSGALGLILGGTLLTIVEFLQFFVQLLNEFGTSVGLRFSRMPRS